MHTLWVFLSGTNLHLHWFGTLVPGAMVFLFSFEIIFDDSGVLAPPVADCVLYNTKIYSGSGLQNR